MLRRDNNKAAKKSETGKKINNITVNNNVRVEETEVPASNQSTRDIIMITVINATGSKIIFTYQVKIDFQAPEAESKFNLMSNFSALMNKLLKLERSIVIGSSKGDEEWTTTRNLQPHLNFNEYFTMM
eukprot:7680488-Ditylum_brightwellii.AAC.1